MPLSARQDWRSGVFALLDTALDRDDAVLADVAAVIADAIGDGKTVYAFGVGHSISLVNEMYRRAGSFKALQPIWNTELAARGPGIDEDAFGTLENKAGCYREFADGLTWRPGDVCWPDSNSGRNALVVEFAQEAKRNGVTVIALTSVPHSTAVPPTPGLPRLLDIANYVLDSCGRLGDASLEVEGVAEPMAPTSTIVGATLVHAAWVGAAELLAAAGKPPEVWASANRGPAAAS